MMKSKISSITGLYLMALLISFILSDNYRIKQDLILEKLLLDKPLG